MHSKNNSTLLNQQRLRLPCIACYEYTENSFQTTKIFSFSTFYSCTTRVAVENNHTQPSADFPLQMQSHDSTIAKSVKNTFDRSIHDCYL